MIQRRYSFIDIVHRLRNVVTKTFSFHLKTNINFHTRKSSIKVIALFRVNQLPLDDDIDEKLAQ